MTGDIDKVITVASLIGTLVIGGAWVDAFVDMSNMAEVMTELESERDAAIAMVDQREAALQAALSELTRTHNVLWKTKHDQSCRSPLADYR